jgi:hypothetical protein
MPIANPNACEWVRVAGAQGSELHGGQRHPAIRLPAQPQLCAAQHAATIYGEMTFVYAEYLVCMYYSVLYHAILVT